MGTVEEWFILKYIITSICVEYRILCTVVTMYDGFVAGHGRHQLAGEVVARLFFAF